MPASLLGTLHTAKLKEMTRSERLRAFVKIVHKLAWRIEMEKAGLRKPVIRSRKKLMPTKIKPSESLPVLEPALREYLERKGLWPSKGE